jgi:hypothetical protein
MILSAATLSQAESQVNTYTSNDQHFPDVAMDAADNFVVVWRSEGQDNGARGIYAQRFNADGDRVGEEFQINNGTVAGRTNDGPSVDMDSSGNFVVAWPGSYNGEEGLVARDELEVTFVYRIFFLNLQRICLGKEDS